MKFSVVIPVKNEIDLIPKTLPSYIALRPEELIIGVDKPTPKGLIEGIERVSCRYKAEGITRVIQVPRGGWGDHQTKVRRTCFLEAKNDRILTGDVDLIVNRNCHKALRLVGKDDIGMVSCSKFRIPHDLLSVYRLFGSSFLMLYVHRIAKFGGKSIAATSFTGLYALWRPFWLDAEPMEVARMFMKLKAKLRNKEKVSLEDFYGSGDDTHLRDCMEKKYKVVALPDVGAFVLTDPWEDRPMIQYSKGIYFAMRGRGYLPSLVRTFLRAQPYYFAGFHFGKKLIRKMKYDEGIVFERFYVKHQEKVI